MKEKKIKKLSEKRLTRGERFGSIDKLSGESRRGRLKKLLKKVEKLVDKELSVWYYE